MKSILLTTTALVAFAGAAVAQETSISFSGNTEFGYNDTDSNVDTGVADDLATPDVDESVTDFDNELGFYWNTDLDVTMTAALDNGLTANTSFELDIVNDANGGAVNADEWVASLESATAGLFIGDIAFAPETLWVSAGDMESDNFSEADGENAIRGDVDVAGFQASISAVISDADGNDVNTFEEGEEFDQVGVAVAGEFGMFTFAVAYQEEADAAGFGAAAEAANGDFYADEVYGVSAGVSVAGADITVAYASNETLDENSTGIKVAYPFGPVVATAYYVSEDDAADEDNYGLKAVYTAGGLSVTADYQDDQTAEKWALEGSYDMGNGLAVYAGVLNETEEEEDYYVAATYDLGGGAEFLISYAEDEDGDQEDEVGIPEYQVGTTVEVSFSF